MGNGAVGGGTGVRVLLFPKEFCGLVLYVKIPALTTRADVPLDWWLGASSIQRFSQKEKGGGRDKPTFEVVTVIMPPTLWWNSGQARYSLSAQSAPF